MLTPVFQPIIRPIVRAVLGASRGGRYNGPSLALRFGENQYLMGAIGKKPAAYQPDSLITFTRSTKAWEWDWQGNYSEVAAGVMRIAHDPLTKSTSTTPQTLGTGSYTFEVAYQYPIGKAVRVSADATNWMVGRVTAASPTSVTIWVSTPPVGAGTYSAWTLIVRRGIRVEEQRTNLAVQSGDFTSASWTKLGGPVITPLTKGQRIDFPSQPDLVSQTNQSIAANAPYTVFVIAARDSGKCTLRITKGDSSQSVRATLDTAARTLVFRSVTGTGVFVSATVTPFESGWDIYALTGSFTAAQVSMGSMLVRESASETTITVLGVQFEVGAALSSYIPTAASQVIRAADVPNVNTLAPWYNATEGKLVVVAEASNGLTSNINRYVTLAGFARLRIGNAVFAFQGTHGAAVDINALSSGVTPTPGRHKVTASYKAGACFVEVDGVKGATDVTSTIVAPTAMHIGHSGTATEVLNGIIESIEFHPRAAA